MNFCTECKDAFTIVNNLDYCETCRIILDIAPGEYQENETQPEIVDEIKRAYNAFGYGIVIS
jgi:hypothetical protein